MLRLTTLGRLDLVGPEGRPVRTVLAQPKRAALLVYLAMASRSEFVRRSTIHPLFWPESDDASARHSLSQALYKLRQALDRDVIEARGDDELRIAGGLLESDVDQFREAVAGRRWADALALYPGDFLPGLELSEAAGFERWAETERASLRRAAADAAWALAEEQAARGAVTEGERSAEQAVALDLVNEPAARRVMNALAAAGAGAEAIRFYETMRARLESELEVEPSAETTALAEKLRRSLARAVQAPPSADGVRAVATAPPAPPSEAAPSAPSRVFVGEQHTIRRRMGATYDGLGTPRRLAWASALVLVGVVVVLTVVAASGDDASPPSSARRQITFTGRAQRPAISPDGHFVAWVRQAADSQLLIQALTGGAIDTIDLPGQAARTIEWSPDGTRILMTGTNTAFLVPRLGGDVQPIAQAKLVTGELLGNWLRDDHRISLHRTGAKSVLVIDLRTDDTVWVAVGGEYRFLLEGDWSPTADMFAVATSVSSDPMHFAILTTDMKGRTQVVIRDTLTLSSPRWSPAGDALYYTRGTHEMWRIGVSRSGARAGTPRRIGENLEARPNYSRREFTVSRDGKRAAYSRLLEHSNLFTIDVPTGSDTASRRQLTNETALLRSPVVSPDGKWIAYTRELNGEAELYRVRLDGTGAPSQVGRDLRISPPSRIAWSPDGSRIAFASVRNARTIIWTIDVRTGETKQYPGTGVSVAMGHLAWSPGQLIAFQPYSHGRIGLLDPVGGGVSYVSHDSAPGHFSPQWSADGNRLAFHRFRAPGDAGIAIYDVRDSSYAFLRGFGGHPSGWSPDSRWIYVLNVNYFNRIEVAAGHKRERFFTSPWPNEDGGQCAPAGPSRPNTFVCALLQSQSDVFVIENFDSVNR